MMNTHTNREAYYFWRAYKTSTDYSVMNAYKTTPSIYKQRAEAKILQEMYNNNGYGYKVVSHNGFQFSCGYLLNDNTLVLHTKANRRIINYNGDYKA